MLPMLSGIYGKRTGFIGALLHRVAVYVLAAWTRTNVLPLNSN